jgi:hypothetical protein
MEQNMDEIKTMPSNATIFGRPSRMTTEDNAPASAAMESFGSPLRRTRSSGSKRAALLVDPSSRSERALSKKSEQVLLETYAPL